MLEGARPRQGPHFNVESRDHGFFPGYMTYSVGSWEVIITIYGTHLTAVMGSRNPLTGGEIPFMKTIAPVYRCCCGWGDREAGNPIYDPKRLNSSFLFRIVVDVGPRDTNHHRPSQPWLPPPPLPPGEIRAVLGNMLCRTDWLPRKDKFYFCLPWCLTRQTQS